MTQHKDFVVLDMNACRDRRLVMPLIERYQTKGTPIYLPAIANWELLKESPETLRASLELMSEMPEAFGFARETMYLKSAEMKYRRPIDDLVCDKRLTTNLRAVLRGIRDDTHAIDLDTVERARTFWKSRVENSVNILRQLEAVHRKELSQAHANEIRAALNQTPSNRSPFRAYLVEAIGGRDALAPFLVSMGYGFATARKAAAFPGFSVLHLFGLLGLALRWRVLGGADTAKESKLENDMADVEYATLAAYGGTLVSFDVGALATFEDIRSVVARMWPPTSSVLDLGG